METVVRSYHIDIYYTMSLLRKVGSVALGVFFSNVGIMHFKPRQIKQFVKIYPRYLPLPEFMVVLTGVGELGGGLGLLASTLFPKQYGPLRESSALFLIHLVVLMSLANIEMAVNNRTIWGNRLSKRGHFFRFCAQIVLLYCLRSLTSSTSPEVRDKYIAYNAIITLCVAIVGHSVGPTDAVATKAM